MSKKIDFTQPLSAEERDWAAQFPGLHGGMLEANKSQFATEPDETLEGSDVEDEAPDYTTWTVSQLDTELSERELPTTGTKADKVRRLEEDDRAED